MFLVLALSSACTVLILVDMRFCMFASFLLYTKMTLMDIMLTSIRIADPKRIEFMRLRK